MATKLFDYEAVSERVTEALSEAFPNSAIYTEEGFEGRVHVKIVSAALNGKSERVKQELVWEVLRARLEEDEQQAVSFILPYGMDELP